MKKEFKLQISLTIFVIILSVMYMTKIGIPGITQYWQDFKLLDMQFTYSTDTVTFMINHLGADGINHYLYYFIVDFTFILTLLYVQVQLSKKLANNELIKHRIIDGFAIGRAVFDLLEDGMLSLIMKNVISIKYVPIASTFTSIKFICLIAWCLLLINLLLKKKVLN